MHPAIAFVLVSVAIVPLSTFVYTFPCARDIDVIHNVHCTFRFNQFDTRRERTDLPITRGGVAGGNCCLLIQ